MLGLTQTLCNNSQNCFQTVQNTFKETYVIIPISIFFIILILFLFFNGLSRRYSRKRLIATKGYLRAFLITLLLGILLIILLFIYPIWTLLFTI